ncbi:hypothetical protein [Micromonospora sp. LOL_024]|uniref:hypothetical protein n=1 Tax=Micromonospora sp. LOL_024 TaxID=3345412 RepID=UPI003A88BD59
MNRFRTSFFPLACAVLLALTACGDEDGTAESSPSTASTTTAAAPATAAPSTATAADVVGDKKLCESAKETSQEMRNALVEAVKAGDDPSPALFKEILGGLEEKLVTLAATGTGDSKVAAALGKFGTEAGRAAAAPDPATAADNPAFEKAGVDLSAACKTTGVDATF